MRRRRLRVKSRLSRQHGLNCRSQEANWAVRRVIDGIAGDEDWKHLIERKTLRGDT